MKMLTFQLSFNGDDDDVDSHYHFIIFDGGDLVAYEGPRKIITVAPQQLFDLLKREANHLKQLEEEKVKMDELKGINRELRGGGAKKKW